MFFYREKRRKDSKNMEGIFCARDISPDVTPCAPLYLIGLFPCKNTLELLRKRPAPAALLALFCSSTPSVCAAKCWLNNIRASNRNYLALRFSALRGEGGGENRQPGFGEGEDDFLPVKGKGWWDRSWRDWRKDEGCEDIRDSASWLFAPETSRCFVFEYFNWFRSKSYVEDGCFRS